MDREAAAGALDCDEAKLESLIEVGAIIGLDIALGQHKELRVLSASIAELQQSKQGDPLRHRCSISTEAALELLQPGHKRPYLVNREIMRALSCGHKHVLRLIRTGQLSLVPGARIAIGQEGRVTRESYIRFSRARLFA